MAAIRSAMLSMMVMFPAFIAEVLSRIFLQNPGSRISAHNPSSASRLSHPKFQFSQIYTIFLDAARSRLTRVFLPDPFRLLLSSSLFRAYRILEADQSSGSA